MRPLILALVVASLGLASVGLLGAGAAQNPPASVPTFNSHVAPIFFENCVTCHRQGGIGPFSLMTFEDARPFSQQIGVQVGERLMPPWYADPQFGEFKNARGLTQSQIDTITAWVEGGAPQGDGRPPNPPTFEITGWRMDRPPDEILELPFGEIELPPSGELPSFSVWMEPLNRERFIEAIEVRPSIPGAVHHSSLSLGTLPPDTKIGRAQVFPNGPVLDGAAVFDDGRPFWSPGGERIAEKPIFFYVPGGGAYQLPRGYGKRFRRDEYIAWGLHLVSPGRAAKLRMQVGLWYARGYPHHEIRLWTVTQRLVAEGKEILRNAYGQPQFPDIPAGAANWSMTGIMEVPVDITIHALWPHMHYRGKDMTFVVTHSNGREETLLSVPRYNPHWQITYELDRPLRVRRGSTITAFGHYDNSSANPHNPDPTVDVKFGNQGIDEMFLPFLEVSVDAEDLTLERFQLPQR